MSVFRSAVAMSVLAGKVEAYREWLRNCPKALAPVFARTGIREKVAVMSGRHVIAHYESTREDSLQAAFSQPEALAELGGPLAALVDPQVPPTFYQGVLAWQHAVDYAPTHVALTLDVKPGKEDAYLDWVRNRLTADFEGVWRRADLAQKEVLVSGTKVIAFYKCRDSRSVLDTFAQPESVAALQTTLGPLLDLDPARPMQVFEEAFVWRA